MKTPTPKYQIGQKVWIIEGNGIKEKEITGIFSKTYTETYFYDEYIYNFNPFLGEEKFWIFENKIFPTKQSLIDSL